MIYHANAIRHDTTWNTDHEPARLVLIWYRDSVGGETTSNMELFRDSSIATNQLCTTLLAQGISISSYTKIKCPKKNTKRIEWGGPGTGKWLCTSAGRHCEKRLLWEGGVKIWILTDASSHKFQPRKDLTATLFNPFLKYIVRYMFPCRSYIHCLNPLKNGVLTFVKQGYIVLNPFTNISYWWTRNDRLAIAHATFTVIQTSQQMVRQPSRAVLYWTTAAPCIEKEGKTKYCRSSSK
jgi:hypothetical protein